MVEHITYWCGPDRTFGTTYAPLDGGTPAWPTQKAAREALRSVYGRLRSGHTILRATAALDDTIDELEERLKNDDLTERIRFAIEARLGYYRRQPVWEVATIRRNTTTARNAGPLEHAVDAIRQWKDIAECGARIDYRHERRFDPQKARACPQCERKTR